MQSEFGLKGFHRVCHSSTPELGIVGSSKSNQGSSPHPLGPASSGTGWGRRRHTGPGQGCSC